MLESRSQTRGQALGSRTRDDSNFREKERASSSVAGRTGADVDSEPCLGRGREESNGTVGLNILCKEERCSGNDLSDLSAEMLTPSVLLHTTVMD